MNFAPKIINKISKCSGKQPLNVSSIFHEIMNLLNCCLIKIIKMADLIPTLENPYLEFCLLKNYE